MQIINTLPKNVSINIINVGEDYTKEQLQKIQGYNNIYLYDTSNKRINDQLDRGYIHTKVVVKPHLLLNRLDFYDRIIKDIKNNNYSPIEALSYIYSQVISCLFPNDFAKNLGDKQKVQDYYKENSEVIPLTDSLNICKNTALILNDRYIHCEGYANIISEIVGRLNMRGLSCQFMSILEDSNGHAIIKTNINDIKYGINGCYFSDPLKDSSVMYVAKKINYPIDTSFAYYLLNYEELLNNKHKLVISKSRGVNENEMNSCKISPDVLENLFLMNSKSYAFNDAAKNTVNSIFNKFHNMHYNNKRVFFENMSMDSPNKKI